MEVEEKTEWRQKKKKKKKYTSKHEGCVKGQSTGSESVIALGNKLLNALIGQKII